MTNPVSDEDFTLDQLKAGDNRAWNTAFSCFYGLAFNVIAGSQPTLSEADLQDVVQDSIIRLIQNYVEKAESVLDLKKLVITIAKHKVLDLIRTRKAGIRDQTRTDSLDSTDAEGQPVVDEKHLASAEPTPANIADQTERAFLLNEALKELPQKQADLLRDFYFLDLKQQEIADKHGLKVSSVGGYLNRALEALEKILTKGKLL